MYFVSDRVHKKPPTSTEVANDKIIGCRYPTVGHYLWSDKNEAVSVMVMIMCPKKALF